jgi:hypothetical protein
MPGIGNRPEAAFLTWVVTTGTIAVGGVSDRAGPDVAARET